MKRLIAAFVIVSALLAGPLAAHAEPMPRDEAAVRLELSRRFIAALQTDQMSSMITQMTTSLTSPQEGLSDAQTQALRRAMATATDEMMSRLFDAMAPIYADIFTLEELNGLVGFYESDIGRSLMAKSYAAAPRVTAVMTAMMPEIMHGMVDTMCKELGCTAQEREQMDAAMAAAGYGAPAASAPASGKRK
jgi:hypothetical protein